jgi:hypothetical protein
MVERREDLGHAIVLNSSMVNGAADRAGRSGSGNRRCGRGLLWPAEYLSRKFAIQSERLRGFQQLRGSGSVPLPAIIVVLSGARQRA